MRALTLTKLQYVNGAGPITSEHWAYVDKVLINTLDGASTGMAIGGKWRGADGFIFGAISQLVGLIVPSIMGGVLGFVGGVTIGPEETGQLLHDYRDKFGVE